VKFPIAGYPVDFHQTVGVSTEFYKNWFGKEFIDKIFQGLLEVNRVLWDSIFLDFSHWIVTNNIFLYKFQYFSLSNFNILMFPQEYSLLFIFVIIPVILYKTFIWKIQ